MLDGNEANLLINESMPDDWFVTDGMQLGDGLTGDHLYHATNLRDPRLSMTWGRTVIDNFRTEWSAKAFFESPCTSFLWVGRAYGNPIATEVMLSADGGRYVLPLPISGTMSLRTEGIYRSRLIHQVEGLDQSYKMGLDMAGFDLPEWLTNHDYSGKQYS